VRAAAGLLALGALAGCTGHAGAHRSPATTSTSTSSPPATVASENSKPGTPGWTVQHPSLGGEIEGYADRVSAQHGDTVTLFVTSTAPTWTATAVRMGWYGGVLARQVWRSPTQTGARQPASTRDPVTNLVDTHWSPSLRVTIDAAWPGGDYLFKLVSSTGWDSYIPLTVRDDSSRAPVLIVNSVTTWQAYNLWGGYDLYEGVSSGGASFESRARIVSFDRPYKIGDGSGDFLGSEYPLVSLVESLGLDLTYTTNLDVHERPESLLKHKVFVSLGHDEYWSLTMRQAAIAARDRGVNFMFLAANALFRHIRLSPSPLGPDRHEIDYKSAVEDPLFGRDNADVTVSWRDPPNSWPEESLIGDYYQCNPVQNDMVVSDASSWVYTGTGLADGARMPGVVGSEYDRYVPGIIGAPPNVELLAHSPVHCRGRPDFADMTYYSASSGAGVFATGTTGWIAHLDPSCGPPKCAGVSVTRITQNVLAAFGAGPAGQQHASTPNLSRLATLPGLRLPGSTSSTVAPTATTTHHVPPSSTSSSSTSPGLLRNRGPTTTIAPTTTPTTSGAGPPVGPAGSL
jgi:hypothetical protein